LNDINAPFQLLLIHGDVWKLLQYVKYYLLFVNNPLHMLSIHIFVSEFWSAARI